MNGVNLMGGVAALRKYLLKDGQQAVILPILAQISFQLPYQSSGDGAQALVGFYGFPPVLGVITEALVTVNFFQDKPVGLA